jgi:hypothetical protein
MYLSRCSEVVSSYLYSLSYHALNILMAYCEIDILSLSINEETEPRGFLLLAEGLRASKWLYVLEV